MVKATGWAAFGERAPTVRREKASTDARLAAQKMRAFCASELEFYLFDETYKSADGRWLAPDEIDIGGLLARVTPEIQEVVLATNPNVEGEATAIYLARLLKPDDDTDSLIERADACLYAAKRTGRNRVAPASRSARACPPSP